MNSKRFFCALLALLVVLPLHAEEANPLDTVMNSSKEKKFTGSPITLKLKDADIKEVMRLISEASGFNVVLASKVEGKITLSLEEVPWDQALDVVMTNMGLAAERSDSVLRVMPREDLLKEKQALIDAEKIATQSAPRITRVFPISYADLKDLSTLLRSFLSSAQPSGGGSSDASSAAGAGAGAVAASIQVDNNTQSLIVRDTAEGVERIRKMIALLDVQTPQIIIEGKVIESSESFTNKINGNFSMTSGASSVSINGALAGAGSFPGGEGSSGVKVGIGSGLSLNAELSYLETEEKAKVVSSPRLMVLSGKSATIKQGANIAVEVITITPGAPPIKSWQFTPYETSLNVTPRATNDGSVFMKLDLTRDRAQLGSGGAPPTVAPRKITTEVVVDSGNTLVLGGVQNDSENINEAGMPFLRKIPLIGWLFGSESSIVEKTEISFFLTPRIVNVKKTAMSDTINTGSDSAPL